MDTYIVTCLDDDTHTRTVLATRRVFTTREEAEAYARTVHHARYPNVIMGDFSGLRLPGEPQE